MPQLNKHFNQMTNKSVDCTQDSYNRSLESANYVLNTAFIQDNLKYTVSGNKNIDNFYQPRLSTIRMNMKDKPDNCIANDCEGSNFQNFPEAISRGNSAYIDVDSSLRIGITRGLKYETYLGELQQKSPSTVHSQSIYNNIQSVAANFTPGVNYNIPTRN